MSNFVLVTAQFRSGLGGWEKRPCRVNAERIEVLEPATDPEGTKIHMASTFLRVEEDISTILFRITQGEKR